MSNVTSFVTFLKEKGISPDDVRVSLLREAWNMAVRLAAERVIGNEGIDFGIKEDFAVVAGMTRDMAVEKFDGKVVRQAKWDYESDDDTKMFWVDLSDEEKLDYLTRAQKKCT